MEREEVVRCKLCHKIMNQEEVEAFENTGEQLCDYCFLNKI